MFALQQFCRLQPGSLTAGAASNDDDAGAKCTVDAVPHEPGSLGNGLDYTGLGPLVHLAFSIGLTVFSAWGACTKRSQHLHHNSQTKQYSGLAHGPTEVYECPSKHAQSDNHQRKWPEPEIRLTLR